MSPAPYGRVAGPVIQRSLKRAQGVAVPVSSTFPFSPMSLSPAVWLDAADLSTITESSGAVSSWADKSGNGRDVTQATPAAMPTTGANTQNGYNVLTFDGGDKLEKSASAIDSDMTIVSLIKVTSNGTYTTPGFNLTTGNQPRPIDRWQATSPNVVYIALNEVAVNGNLRGWTTWKVWSCTYSKTTTYGPRWVEYDNNVQVSSVTNTGAHNVANQKLTIGRRDDNVTDFRGQMAEFLIFPSVLTVRQRADVHQYLVTKWGI